MKTMPELIKELKRAEREYPALTHHAGSIEIYDGTVTLTHYNCNAKARIMAAESEELKWYRYQHKNGIDWRAKTGAIMFKLYAMEPVEEVKEQNLGPVSFIPPVQVIEPEDLCDGPTDLEREQLIAAH